MAPPASLAPFLMLSARTLEVVAVFCLASASIRNERLLLYWFSWFLIGGSPFIAAKRGPDRCLAARVGQRAFVLIANSGPHEYSRLNRRRP